MNNITNQSLFELSSIANPLAGDGVYFFTQTHIDAKQNSYITHIYGIHPDSKEIKQYGDGSDQNSRVMLSPDKKFLSFLSKGTNGKVPQLYVMSVDGGLAQKITEEEEGIQSYVWLNDSSSIYYQTKQKKENEEKSESEKDTFPQPTEFTTLTTKADGVGLVSYTHRTLIKKLNVRTKEIKEVASFEKSIQLNAVSRDESFMIYTCSLIPEDELAFGKSATYYYDLKTNERKNWNDNVPNGTVYYAGMNPSEEYLLLMGNDFSKGFVTQTELYVVELKTNTWNCLTEMLDSEIGDYLVADFQQNVSGVRFEWLDDTHFIFSATEKGKVVLYTASVEGSITKVLDERMHITGSALLSNKKELVITYSTWTTPSCLAVVNIESGSVTDVYNPNEQFEKEHVINDPERFWYKGYQEWDIQGWYLPPVEKKQQHAAILYIHGGPQVAYGETFFHEMHVLAGLGYGVILLNPRGGNSYGQEFVQAILGEYGKHDFDDLMLGVEDVLKRHPEIDTDKLYVTGGSYGGFMTNWIVTQTNRFKAAVTQRSISNWISFYGVSDIGPFFVEYQLQADVVTGMEALWSMSPLAHVQNVETPLLILHGEEDTRCPKEQAEQFYTVLKRLGKEVKMILFPQSSHGLSRSGLPNLRIKRLEAIQEWFKEH